MARPRTAKRAEIVRLEGEALLLRPEVRTQASLRKQKPPKTYRCDASVVIPLWSPGVRFDESAAKAHLGAGITRLHTLLASSWPS